LLALHFGVADASRPLRNHQKTCILLGTAYPKFAFHLAMGLGKSRITLELLRQSFLQKKLRCALVLVPSEPAIVSWEDQITEWKIGIPFISLMNSASAEKWAAVNEFEDGIIIATYPGLVRMLTKQVKGSGKKKGKLVPCPSLIKKLQSKVGALVLDEATLISHQRSLAYRLCYQLSKKVDILYELAGRPFGRDPTTLWAQLNLIDGGETLGETLGLFRAAFFDEKPNYFGGMDYKFRKDMEPKLHDIIKHRSIAYSAEECIDLPKLITKVESINLPQQAQAYYANFVKQIRMTHAGFQERKNIFLRMRQVSSGFVGFMDDETGEKAEIAFASNPKLDRLLELIDEMPLDAKFVVFHEFTVSGKAICKALTDAKIKHEWMWGGSKEPRAMQTRFDKDPKCRGMVVNHKKGAYALNLQRASYTFFYESPVSVIDREQAEKRVYRQGQTKPVVQIDLVCKGTVDQRILDFHAEGRSLFDAIIRNPDKALKGLF